MFHWSWKCSFNICLNQAILIQECAQVVQGYQVIRNDNLATLEIENQIKTAKEIIEIEDDSEVNQASDSDSDDDVSIPSRVGDWIRNTQANQQSLQYYDVETSKWMGKEEDVSDEFLGELTEVVGNLDNNSLKNDGGRFAELDMDFPRNAHEDREMTDVPGFARSELDTDPVTQNAVAAPAANHPAELMNLDELCADVMRMHKCQDFNSVQENRNINTNYEFAWTGM